ncbi:L-lactate permease [Clostridium sp.]|uniref:L-lactate permease n=1 Tax=Clostridium sp. TaxID=1506 RepID=UPI002FC9B127
MDIYFKFIIALLPIILLMVALGVFKVPGHIICPIALVCTIILAVLLWKMPLLITASAALEGIALAIWPIMLVIIAAVFTYNLSIYTKGMDVIKKMLTSVTTDKRILVLILAFGFGGFLEAVAGFGTAVAIPAGIMAALGFEPIFAAVICLIANTTPTAFGAIGLPVTTLAEVSNISIGQLSYTIAIQLFMFIILLPFILVMITGKGIKALKGVVFITFATGTSFAIVQLIVAKYLGAELPAVIGSVVSMGVTIFIAKTFYKEKNAEYEQCDKVTFKQGVKAWLPFILIFIFIILISPLFPKIYEMVASVKTSVTIYKGEGAMPYTFVWLASPGTLIILAAFIGGLVQGAKFSEIVKVLTNTVKQMFKSSITIISIIALAKVMGYSGMIKSVALVLVMVTGSFYPLISPLIGALGTFVTGSDTSANVLFGGLQVEAAKSLGTSPYWLAAANTCGATAGKMISPQSIAVATAATGIEGEEGKILNSTLKYCVGYVVLLGIITYAGTLIFV